MSAWKAKRFWTEATAEPCEGGFTVRLDGRAVKTPAKRLLVVPTQAMAEAIAAEWQAQQGLVKPDTMPVTRAANSALDKVAVQFDEVVDLLAAYGETDLLCYRATGPQTLLDRQANAWDPVLDWSATVLSAPLLSVAGVMHIAQPEQSLVNLRTPMREMSPFQLVAFHDLVAISGSLVLALAVTRNWLSAPDAWRLSRIDEQWQIEQWGTDEEAMLSVARKQSDYLQACSFWKLASTD